jgi:hypothetical protein
VQHIFPDNLSAGCIDPDLRRPIGRSCHCGPGCGLADQCERAVRGFHHPRQHGIRGELTFGLQSEAHEGVVTTFVGRLLVVIIAGTLVVAAVLYLTSPRKPGYNPALYESD